MLCSDVAIIGAGPVGLFSVFACGMMRLTCHLIDTLPCTGGQCRALYPEKPIYDIPGFPQISGERLIKQLEEQMAPFAPHRYLGENVDNLEREQNILKLHLSSHRTLNTRAVIIAGGAGAFTPHKPALENISNYEGKSIFYAVKEKNFFKHKKIVIAGGGDSAIDWALELAQKGKCHVSLVHRRDTFRASPDNKQRLKQAIHAGCVHLHTPFQLDHLEGDVAQGTLHAVHLKSMRGNLSKTLPADILLPFFGLKSQLGSLENWGLELEGKQIVIDPTTAKTNKDNIYACGDIATYPFKRKLIATGFGEAMQAAAHIRRTLYPEAASFLGHSTSTGLPKLRHT